MLLERAGGFVLIVALLAVLIMSTLAGALVAVVASETLIAGNFRGSQEALHAADAAAERALADLASSPDWTLVLSGAERSTFVDGPPGGGRALPSGQRLDLGELVNRVNCGAPAPCSAVAMDQVTGDRPRGPNNPRWQLYAYGPLEDALPALAIGAQYYAVVLVGDDPSELDGDPLRDSPEGSPGSGVVALHVEVFGVRGVHKVLELTVSRTAAGGIRLIAWHEIRVSLTPF